MTELLELRRPFSTLENPADEIDDPIIPGLNKQSDDPTRDPQPGDYVRPLDEMKGLRIV